MNTKKWSLEPLAGLFRGIQSVRMKEMFGWLMEEPALRAVPYKSASCPNLTRATDVRRTTPHHLLRKARSEVFPSVCKPAITTTLRAAACACPPPPPANLMNESVQPDTLRRAAVLEKLALSCGPCCGPCGPCGPCGCGGGCACGCGSLPPPCNTPPRCLQAMTGYYYYPYGVWFCGPYHVTNTCCPGGPVSPGGPCGPNPPAPGGPCGPCAPGCCCGVVDPTAILNTASNGPAASKGAASSNSPVSSNNPACTANGPAKSMSTMCPPVSLACGPCCCRPYKCCKSCGPCHPCGPCCGRSCYPCGPCGAYSCCRGCGCGPCCGGCCGPCGPCGYCGPCGPYRCGPYACCGGCGPCGCGCGPCGCGPCGCGPCGCGPCGCAPCGCGSCGCGPCGCGPCGCGLCGCGPCGSGCPPCRCGCGAFGCCCGVGPVGGINDGNLNTSPFPAPTVPPSVSFPFMGSEQQHSAPPIFTHDPLKNSRPPAPMPAAPLCRSPRTNEGDNPHASKNMTSQLAPNVTCYCALCRAARVLSHSAEDEEFRFPPDDITPKPVPLSIPKSEETVPFNRKFHYKKKRVC